MKVYFGFDDTDAVDSAYGTGKLVRWFQNDLPHGCECLGVVRQQLFVCDAIPYTSHNSAACLIAEIPSLDLLNDTIDSAVNHIEDYSMDDSDPGLCVVTEFEPSIKRLIDFGHCCACAVSTQKQALEAAKNVHLSGHGGTNDGIIGAAAAVGLTVSGWSGRFIEYGDLRDLPDEVSIENLKNMGMEIVSMDRDSNVPAPDDTVMTNGWIRPRLLGHLPVLFVNPVAKGQWRNVYSKRKKRENHLGSHQQIELKN
jgi:tRNA(Ile2) C34 agmatinyltransferase TiaS